MIIFLKMFKIFVYIVENVFLCGIIYKHINN